MQLLGRVHHPCEKAVGRSESMFLSHQTVKKSQFCIARVTHTKKQFILEGEQ
jgi:hypothetical protein